MAEESGIHDITLEKGITPIPRGVFEEWKKVDKAFKLFQMSWYEKDEFRRGSSSGQRPKLLDFPITLKDLPTSFFRREGKRLYGQANESTRENAIPFPWPQTTQDLQLECKGNDECYFFTSRGYLCKIHNPSTSTLQLISYEKASLAKIKDQKVKVWIT